MTENYQPIFAATPKNMLFESVIKEQQEGYYQALRGADAKGDCTEFIEFMLDAILKTCQEAQQAGDVPRNVPKDVPLKRRQRILELIGADHEITITRLAELCGVSGKTVKRDIARLKDEKRLIRVGSQKSGHWQVRQ